MGGQLALNTKLESVARCGCSLLQGVLLKWGANMHIKSSWSATTPVWKKDISWPREKVQYQAEGLL